jgi:triosephosphate isomerase
MNKTLIVGNWKMHLNAHEASLLVHRLNDRIKIHHDIEIVLAPSLLTLQPLSLQIDRRKFRLAAQNANQHDQGPYTGEVSFTMLHELVHYAIIGHSERRIHFNETLEIVRDKVAACVRNKITPILCVGETAHERKAGEAKQVVHDQLSTAISNLTTDDMEDFVIAYEPVWAIGTGVTAKPDDIDQMIFFIRQTLKELYGERVSKQTRVIYGAGVEPEYVKGILSLRSGVDGLLPGSASLNYHKFAAIVEAAYALHHEAKDD